MEEEERDLVREYRRLKLRELVERRRKSLEELGVGEEIKIGKSSTGQSSTALASTLVASLVAQGLKPEEVDDYIKKLSPEALAALSAIASNNPMAAVVIAAMSRGNPQGLTVKDVVEIADKMRGGPQLDDVMPHTQPDYDGSRFEAYRLARRLMWREAYWDRDKAETISLNDYEPLQVYRGDVIKQAHYYIHPALTAAIPR